MKIRIEQNLIDETTNLTSGAVEDPVKVMAFQAIFIESRGDERNKILHTAVPKVKYVAAMRDIANRGIFAISKWFMHGLSTFKNAHHLYLRSIRTCFSSVDVKQPSRYSDICFSTQLGYKKTKHSGRKCDWGHAQSKLLWSQTNPAGIASHKP